MGYAARRRRAGKTNYAQSKGTYWGSYSEAGPGAQRAGRFFAKKQKANKRISAVGGETRQQRRAKDRADRKAHISRLKKHVMAQKVNGGSAIIRGWRNV